MKNQMQTSIVRLLVASICALMIAVAFFGVSAPNAQAKPNATITVNTLLDTIATDGVCSLREAIQSAESGMPVGSCTSGTLSVDTINIIATGTIALNSALPVITQDVNIVGPGSGLLTISGAGAYRPFTINASAKVNLSDVTIANGYTASNGGGVYNAGTLTITNASITNNTAAGAGAFDGGGGIHNDVGGTVTLMYASVISNTATKHGGGIYSTPNGTTIILSSNVYSNSAGVNAGGIMVEYGNLSINSSNVYSNTAVGYGGGLYLSQSVVTMTNTSIYDNVGNSGGGIYSALDTTLNINGNSFYGNGAVSAAGGGIYVAANDTQNITIANSTFFGNTAQTIGGGIFMTNLLGSLNLINTTFSANKGTGGGNIYRNAGVVTLKNTLVANSVVSGNCGGIITDGGNNLQFGGTVADSCGATIPTADPKLAPLANYGGPTKTLALYPGSAAINAGNNAVCAAAPVNNLDQRGYARPVGGACDIGAVEGTLTLLYLPFISK